MGIPKITCLMLKRGVIDQVCRDGVVVGGGKADVRRRKRYDPKNPPCVSFLRTPPSTMRSTPFMIVLVNPAVALCTLLVAVVERRVGTTCDR